MSYDFRPSINEDVSKTVLFALAGTTGSGKTESAMRIARGIVGPKGKFVVIDTENKRALNKKTRYQPWDHLNLKPPYSPESFKGALDAAEKAGYKAIVVDNFSHEWFGEGGCSDIQEEALERLSGGNAAKAMQLSALAWKKPKQDHKKLMYRILQCSVPVIFCLRAEPKIKFTKDENGKMQVVDAGWQPIAEKMFGYEMLCYILLMPDNPGVPFHLKQLEPEFRAMFPDGKQINENAGRLIAEWAASGGNGKAKPEATKDAPEFVNSETGEITEGPSPEEERAALEAAGMIPKADPIEKFKADLKACTTKSEIGKVFKAFVEIPENAKHAEEAAGLANDRQAELRKAA